MSASQKTVGAALAIAAILSGPSAHAVEPPQPRSLLETLAGDGQAFDSYSLDYDIVEAAALAVLGEKPESSLALLADSGNYATALLPTDGAFRALVRDVMNRNHVSEALIYRDVAALGTDTVEQILLGHVVTTQFFASQFPANDGRALTTLGGSTITIDIVDPIKKSTVLRDSDPNDQDPRVLPSSIDINSSPYNYQVAHGINRVIRPFDLP
ncbi:MAG: fasciclin domain-containing protein [Actinomycetota bacterium]